MTIDQGLQIIRLRRTQPGQLVMPQWFLGESGGGAAIHELVRLGYLQPSGHQAHGLHTRYTLLKPV